MKTGSGWGSRPAPSLGVGQPSAEVEGRSLFDVFEGERYQIGARIGQGGMGRVLMAYDRRLGRDVALKELLSDGPELAARLQREAQITAALDHPGIVPVYDAGRSAGGRLFYTMRLVRGRTLADLLAADPDPAARLRLVPHLLEACRAVAFAHERRIVHRDLKPANLLVGPLGETQVADWGLARRLEEPAPSAGTPGAASGAVGVLGTPRYLAPELARGESADARSDVWSLGAVLFELLVGAPPWSERDAIAAVAATAAHGAPPVLARVPGANPELAAIADRATRLDPAARYPSAGALAADLLAWLEGRRVEAHAYSPLALLLRLIRAWRGPLLVVGAAAVVTVVGGMVAWRQTARERDRAVAAEQTTREALAVGDRRLAALLLAQARAAEGVGARAEAELLAAHSLALDPTPQARGVLLAFAAQPPPRLQASLPSAGCRLAIPGGRGGRWLCLGSAMVSLRAPDGRVLWERSGAAKDAVLAAEGGSALVRGADDALALLALEDGAARPVGMARAYGAALGLDPRHGLAFSADRGVLALVGRDGGAVEVSPCGAADLQGAAFSRARAGLRALCGDGRLVTLSPEGAVVKARQLSDPGLLGRVSAVAQGPGEDLLVGTLRGEVARIRLPEGRLEALGARATLGQIRRLEGSPEGRRAMVIGERGGPALLDLETGAWLARLPASDRGRAAFVDEGTLQTSAGRLATWALPAAPRPRRLEADGGLGAVAISPDGDTVAAVGSAGRAFAWSLADGARRRLRLGLERTIKQVAFAPDGGRIVVGGVDHTHATLAELPGLGLPGLGPRRLESPARLRGVGWLADGTVWAIGYGEGPFAWRGGARLSAIEVPGRNWLDGATTVDGRAALLVADDGEVFRLDPAGAERLLSAPGASQVAGHGAFPVFVADRQGIARFDGPARLAWRLPVKAPVVDLAVSADGRWLAGGTRDGEVLLVAAASGRLVGALRAHEQRAAAVAFSPDGARLVSAGWDGAVRVWGLDALEAAPSVEAVEARWGLGLDAVLGAPLD